MSETLITVPPPHVLSISGSTASQWRPQTDQMTVDRAPDGGAAIAVELAGAKLTVFRLSAMQVEQFIRLLRGDKAPEAST